MERGLMMDLQVRGQDLELARRISREARADPASPYARKYVGILDGQVVVTADSPAEGLRELRKIEPDRGKGMLIDASVDCDAVDHIWGA
jgi:hypothetical protein